MNGSSTTVLLTSLQLAAVASPVAAAPQPDPDDPFISGGMMAHLTPVTLSTTGDRDVALGLGGRVHVNVLRYLRLGMMGVGGTMTYGSLDSEFHNGAGGATIQARLPILPVELAVGVLVGGESATVHHYLAEGDDGLFTVQRTDASGFLLSPVFDLEVTLVRRIKLALTVQYRHATWLDDLYRPTVTFHLGLLFNTYRPS